MSLTTVNSKTRMVPIRFEHDMLDWAAVMARGRGTATILKEKLRALMNDDIAKGRYKPKRVKNAKA